MFPYESSRYVDHEIEFGINISTETASLAPFVAAQCIKIQF